MKDTASSNSAIRIALCDDHMMLTEGLATVIAIKYPNLQIQGIFHDGYELLQNFSQLKIDVLLLDLKIPGLDGISILRHIMTESPKTKVIMLTTFDDRELISQSIRAGARGFLLKQQPVQEIIEAIEQVQHGGLAFAKCARQSLALDLKSFIDKESKESVAKLERLSPKELSCAHCILLGYSNKEISLKLNISDKTVRNYISNIYNKIDIHQRSAVILWLRRHLNI